MADLDLAALDQIADMHAVYRMFGRAFRLLYVGKTGSAGQRFGDHSAKRWFPQVQMITLQWFETAELAAVEERRAIATEGPVYNVAGNRKRQRVLPDNPRTDALVDVLTVFNGENGLHWQVLASRLEARFPVIWTGATGATVSAHCRALGVPSVDVKADGRVAKGCRRADVERTAIGSRLTVDGAS